MTDKVNDYFGTDDKETAIWFFGGLGFTILCGVIVIIVSVVI
ncbi:hypothetical protein [Carnobacterium maltaromaticum]|nr:hypothetical protein [Carnobacterium maltaromaticum]